MGGVGKSVRTEPYTAIGIKRVPCAKCGNPSHASWNVCADNVRGKPQYRGLCIDCDIGLNALAMRYVFGTSRESDIEAYANQLR